MVPGLPKVSVGGGNRGLDTPALLNDSFHDLLASSALAIGLGLADWSDVQLFYGKWKVQRYGTHSMGL